MQANLDRQNHIAHQLLTIYALGATPAQLQARYDENAGYQRPPVKLEPNVVRDMHDPEKFKQCFGKEKYYHDYVVFFQGEIEKKGWEKVLNEYVFKGDERAESMFGRLFAGEFPFPFSHRLHWKTLFESNRWFYFAPPLTVYKKVSYTPSST